jgi:hypothetical protein
MRMHTLVALKLENMKPTPGILLSIFHVLYREFGASLRMLDLENGDKEMF